MLHQLLTYKLGVNIYLLYIFGLPSVMGLLFTGGFRRLFRFRPAFYWFGFAACISVASVFSSWLGGSVGLVSVYLKTDFIMLPLLGGLAIGWKECRTIIFTIALSTLVSELSIKLFSSIDINGRTALDFGSIQNSNDYAAHLILIVPFLLWAALSAKSFLFRLVAMLGVAYGCYLIVASGSRGGFIALVTGVAAMLVMGTSRQRMVGLFTSAAMLFAAIALVPPQTFQRILSLSEDNSSATSEALQSSRIRKQLLQDSMMFAITHPLLGLGPGRFSEIEGLSRKVDGQVGLYFEAHNSFMTVASECGTPALICYVAGIVSSILLLNRIRRKVADDPDAADVRNAVSCMKTAIIAYCVATFFVNFAYFFYLPALSGLITAMAAAFLDPERQNAGTQIPVASSRMTPRFAPPVPLPARKRPPVSFPWPEAGR
jgi:O-antigen ligase